MLNKRAATLLAFVLAGSMALSTPAAAMAASGSEKASQTEDEESDMDDETEEEEDTDEKESRTKEDEDTDSGKEKKTDSEDEEEDTKDVKKAKSGKVSSNSSKPASSSSNKTAEKTTQKQPRAGEGEDTVTSTSSGNEVSGNTPTPGGNVSGNVISAGDFKLSGDLSEGEDYSYEETPEGQQILTIKTDKKVTLSGTVAYGKIAVNSQEGADLTLDDLQLGADRPNNNIEIASGAGKVQIHLSGQKENTFNTLVNGTGESVAIDGPGILKMSRAQKTVVIGGGNIQRSPLENVSWENVPLNAAGTELYAVSVKNLNPSSDYAINGLAAGTPLAEYNYGDQIRSDSDGTIVMYLPAGAAALALNNTAYRGTVTSDGKGELTVQTTGTPVPSGTPIPSGTITPVPSPTTPVSDMQADPADNGLYWINSGATYRSGATLQFYATGAGYGPEEPQDTDPERGATRYKPVSWTVAPSTSGSGTSDKGSWSKRSEVTTGQTVSGAYTSGEYRYKASFTPSTSQTSSVAYTLQVKYERETYQGKNRKWRKDGTTDTKSVSFYIRNTNITPTLTPTYTPRPTYYSTTTPIRTTITTTASRNSISSNARNASTGDHTPIGTLVFMMIAAAGSGIGIFRKKRDSF